MKVQSLKIASFRGIDDLTLEFNPNAPTILIGINGVGKSSILDCLAILLSWFANRLLYNPKSRTLIMKSQGLKSDHFRESELAKGRIIDQKEVRNGCGEALIEVTTSFSSQQATWSISSQGYFILNRSFSVSNPN
ncbi:AAA family ATPase [Lusitaniella coriacea]|uniref:AAA family ATPase n=1 Tax=Lusitaniella coriacea TaxID=1983105 RepID=UPI003CF8F0C4